MLGVDGLGKVEWMGWEDVWLGGVRRVYQSICIGWWWYILNRMSKKATDISEIVQGISREE